MRNLRVYNQVFRIEKTVYSIQGVSLPMPVSYRQMAFFVGTLLLMLFLNKIPPFIWIDYYLIKFVAIPLFVAWFFTRKTLDGKAPHRFLIRVIDHFFGPRHHARYQEIARPRKKYFQYDSNVTYRNN